MHACVSVSACMCVWCDTTNLQNIFFASERKFFSTNSNVNDRQGRNGAAVNRVL